ncbi:hypothetical protein RBB50_002092 [Rhinocladiella similis]
MAASSGSIAYSIPHTGFKYGYMLYYGSYPPALQYKDGYPDGLGTRGGRRSAEVPVLQRCNGYVTEDIILMYRYNEEAIRNWRGQSHHNPLDVDHEETKLSTSGSRRFAI